MKYEIPQTKISRRSKSFHLKQQRLIPAKHTLNSSSRSYRWLCLRERPCKSMRCSRCQAKRRSLWIAKGVAYAHKHGLYFSATVAWPLGEGESSWWKLLALTSELSKRLSGRKLGKYIRSLGVGARGCPHIHYLASYEGAQKIRIAARIRKLPKPDVCIEQVDPGRWLGYLFDQNFLPAFLDPERPKGVRILSASRGMPCGFPTARRKPAKQFGEAPDAR